MVPTRAYGCMNDVFLCLKGVSPCTQATESSGCLPWMAWALSSGRRLLSGGLPAPSGGGSAGAGSERHCLQARSCPKLRVCHKPSATRAVGEAQRWERCCTETAHRRRPATLTSGSPGHPESPLLEAIISAHSMLWLVHQSPIPALGPSPDPRDSCAGVLALARV